MSQLVGPARDAQALGYVLADADIGDFTVDSLVNEPSYKVEQAIEAFFGNAKREDLLLLYFSGHGLKDQSGQLHFAMTNTERSVLSSTSVQARWVSEVMQFGPARTTVVLLDCCYSGAFARGLSMKSDSTVHTGEHFLGSGRVVLTASDAMQYAFEGDEVVGEGVQSVFTRVLTEGLQTGEADRDRDGYVSFDELYDYVHTRVTEERPQQKPCKWEMGVQGRVVIAKSARREMDLPMRTVLPPSEQAAIPRGQEDPPQVNIGIKFLPPEPDVPPPPPAVEPAPARTRRRTAAYLAVVCILALAGAGIWYFRAYHRTHSIPNVQGKTEAEATGTLRALKFRPVVESASNDDGVPLGTVASQAPETGRLREGTEVQLRVSTGPSVSPVPDLTNRTQQQAVDELINTGFRPGAVNKRADPKIPAGQVVEWTGRGTSARLGTTIDLTVSDGAQPPPPTSLLPSGNLAPGRYTTGSFSPKVTINAMDGWFVEDADSADTVVLSRKDRPTSKISFVRVQRVYNPNSPYLDQHQISTTEDALNSIQDVRDLQDGLAAWLSTHPRRVGANIQVTPTSRGGRTGNQVDVQFRASDYQNCAPPINQCVPLFQLYGNDGGTSSFAKVASEVTRFEVFDLISGVKIVVATSALEGDFAQFVKDAQALLNVELIDFTDRLSTPRVRSSVNPSDDGQPVSLTAEVNSPCTAGKVLFSVNSARDHTVLGSAEILNGKAALDNVMFKGRGGRARVIAEYDGTDCAKGISAPLLQAVN
ncbi:MAG: PASTA domain-containing protein [Actinomycetota bacterium]|nr:PASTA domain-containing protein [Actinomycetota bacterium]